MTTASCPLRRVSAEWPALLAFCFLWLAASAQGNTLTWNGGGGANANWNNSANWGGAGTPNNGDTLIFKGAAGLLNTNNISSLTLGQIRFGGGSGSFDIRGNAFTLTNCIMATNSAGANVIEPSITLATSDVLLIISNNATLTLSGILSGSVGVNKTGLGTVIYQGASSNTYSGTTLVSAGTLQLNVGGISAFGGPLVIGDGTGTGSPTVQLLQSTEISDSAPITINNNGTLDLNNFFETIGPNLTLAAGYIYTGTGTLTLSPNTTITVTNLYGYSSAIYGNLNIGSGTLTLQGTGVPLQPNGYPFLYIWANVSGSANIVQNATGSFFGTVWEGSNTYTGNYTANNASAVYLENSLALGNINNTLTINNQGQVYIGGNINITNQSLAINGGNPGAAFNVDNGNGACTNSWRANFTFSSAGWIDIPTNCALNLIGPISGIGGLTKIDSGTLTLSGSTANTYSGTTTVSGGTLLLNKPSTTNAIPGALVLQTNSTVRLLSSFQIFNPAASITLSNSSLLDLNGFSEWVGPITMQGAQITSGAGTLFFNSNITVNASTVARSLINGNASIWNGTYSVINSGHNYSPDLRINANISSGGIGGGGLIKDGGGEVALNGNNSFVGPVTVNAGTLWAEMSTALGNTNTTATVNNGGSLFLDGNGLDFGLKPFVLNGPGWSFGALFCNGSSFCEGNITLNGDSTIYPYPGAALTLSGGIIGAGNLALAGPGTNTFYGTNADTFIGTTIVSSGTLLLNKSFGGAVPGSLAISNACVVRLLNAQQIATTADVLVSGGALLDFTTNYCYIDTLRGSGTVNFGTGGWIGLGYNNGSSEFDGSFIGIGNAPGFTVGKFGTGTFTIGGNSTYTAGITHVVAGKLVVNGSQPLIPVTVDSGSTLAGTGSVGIITANGAISPGNSLGILNSSNITFSASGNFSALINGATAGTGYNQLNVTGTVSLASAALQVTMGVVGATNNQYTIINNDGADAVSGTFAGLPEGSSVLANNGVRLTISYHGGTGNDVVLTQTNLPPQPVISGIQKLLNGTMQLNGAGITNLFYSVWANTNLSTATWISIGSAAAPANTNTFQFTDTNAPNYPVRFYRFSWP